MLKKILIGLVVIIAAVLIYAALQPPKYVITREVTINAPATKIFPYLNNQKLAEQWGPWMEEDPDAKMEISGPADGVGSKTSWHGGKKLGSGSATIVESKLNEKVGIKLVYAEPMSMEQYSEYIIKPSGSQNIVIWRVEGENNFMGRVMCVFMNMDKLVGSMFEKGLNKLKVIAEK